ncbi:uncharacterized protein LOC119739174 [Patiria miniata]|uniref:Uncharacterized protein n=1 Tax=Patiria miniata TaxID=46514 RepID=A0A914B1Z3_PATMI|nr:uncharacterized protein LOC119739174 [Patiria miniata]
MLAVMALCFLLIKAATCEMQVGSDGIEKANLGSYMLDLACNDAGTECMKCFTVHKFGRPYLYTFKFSKDHSINFQITVTTALQNYDLAFTQGEANEPFDFCGYLASTYEMEIHSAWDGKLCAHNNFSGVSVPAECGQPVALVSVVNHLADEAMRGQQVLYCMPKGSD